jgi:integrating conjugative element protein (TIGR03761 family)
VLRSSATLTLHTRQAQRLVKGRAGDAEKPAIIGLIGFAGLLRPIWLGARADDPYADWWMLRVHQALEQAREGLSQASAALDERLQGTGAIAVSPSASLRPVRVPLQFGNPYAYRGALLLADYDALVCRALTSEHVGLVTRDEAERALHLGGRWVRRALQSPLGYRLTGVTRADLAQGTAKAQQAHEAMGEVPDEVLSGSQRAPHGPSRPALPTVAAQFLRLQPLAADA